MSEDQQKTAKETQSVLEIYGPAFGTALLATASYSAEATAFQLIGVTLGASALPVLAIGLAITLMASGDSKTQAEKIPSIISPSMSPFSLITIPVSVLASPRNDPTLMARALTPGLDLGTGITARDEAVFPSSIINAKDWHKDTQEYYNNYLKPQISALAQKVSDFIQSLRSNDEVSN